MDMIHDIKFRYKVKGRKDYLYDSDKMFGYLHRGREMIVSMEGQLLFVEEEMQFIGHRDKNGKDVYEKDIIKSHFYNGALFRVVRCKGYSRFCAESLKDREFQNCVGDLIYTVHHRPSDLPHLDVRSLGKIEVVDKS